jgi:hypothetical protein
MMMLKTLRLYAPGALFACLMAPATAGDLLIHDGFETCWVSAQTKAQFLESVRSSIDGSSACIPALTGNQSGIDYTVCAAANGCGAGIEGCPVILGAGTFSGDFLAGSLSGPGSAADIVVPITTSIFPACSVRLNAISLDYELDYLMRLDGVDGVYSDDMMAPSVTISNYTLTNINCNGTLFALIGGNVATAVSAAEGNVAATIEPGLRTDTLDRSVCPLSAP